MSITSTCLRCGAQVNMEGPYNWAEHENICPSTLAELDRFKKQNAEFIVELTRLRALREGVVKLVVHDGNDDIDDIDIDVLIDGLVNLLEASR